MRTYPINSAEATARLLALTIIADGSATPLEISATTRACILKHVSLDETEFNVVLHDLCDDLLATTYHGVVRIETKLIDCLLMEITNADLRRGMWQAMWQVAAADGWLADAEAVVLARAAVTWGAESSFTGSEGITYSDSARPMHR